MKRSSVKTKAAFLAFSTFFLGGAFLSGIAEARVHGANSTTVAMENHDDKSHDDYHYGNSGRHGRKHEHQEKYRDDNINSAVLNNNNKDANNIKNRIDEILHPKNYSLPNEKDLMAPIDFDDIQILGRPMATQQQCVDYLLRSNPYPNISVSPQDLVAYYYEEGELEGVRPDVAFVQALKETGFFRYGGTVTPDQNNYCGLGTTSATVKGAYFATARMGVRAHIQHLLAYASLREPSEPIVDPRFELVREKFGGETFGTWIDLNGRWAVPGYTYGQSIMEMFGQLFQGK